MRKLTKQQKFEKKMREYRRFLKDDHDWDWEYIIRLLRYKLSRTRICIQNNNIVMCTPKIVRQITQVEALLKRVEDDSYYDELSEELRKKGVTKSLKHYAMAHRRRSNDLKKAFTLLHKNMWGWWD